MFCQKCGYETDDDLQFCLHCGAKLYSSEQEPSVLPNVNGEWTITLFLCTLFGLFGAHRFYTGYTGIGIAQLLTLGGCGIWTLVDLLSIVRNNFETKDGRKLNGYIKLLGVINFCWAMFVIFLIVIFILGVSSGFLAGVLAKMAN